MAQFSRITLKTAQDFQASINVQAYAKDNLTPFTVTATGAVYMKWWIDQTASPTDVPASLTWKPFVSSVLPNFSVEGNNYVHIVLRDEVGIESVIINSTVVVFDKTAPSITNMVIGDGSGIIKQVETTVRVYFTDALSGVNVINFDGDLAEDSTRTAFCSDADREAGYKDVSIKFRDPVGSTETLKVRAQALDRAGNSSTVVEKSVVVASGDVDIMLQLLSSSDVPLGKHINVQAFKRKIKVDGGLQTFIQGYKDWGDFNTDGGAEGKAKPTEWTTWTASATEDVQSYQFTSADGNKTVNAEFKMLISSVDGTVPQKMALPQSAGSGEIYKVTADETRSNKTTFYIYSSSNTWRYFGDYNGTDNSYSILTVDPYTIHYSTASPTLTVVSDVTAISDKTGHDTATLTVTFTSACNINEYKVVGYATQAAAEAGTYADASNIGCYGTTPIESGGTWAAQVKEANLILAIPNEGIKYLVAYGKNECDNKGKSNIVSVNVDLTAPVGTVTVNQYYNANSGFTFSATDTGSSVSKVWAWVNDRLVDETVPQDTPEVNYHPNLVADEVNWTGKVQGNNKVHIKIMDAVGNISFLHSNTFVFDNVAPYDVTVTCPQVTATTTLAITISAQDATSGVAQMYLDGNVVGEAQWIPYSTSHTITLTSGDGDKTFTLKVKDNAGNESTVVSKTIKLDTQGDAATVTLYKTDDATVLPSTVNVVDFIAHIAPTDVTIVSTIAKYKIWGDITAGSSEASASWREFVVESGQTYTKFTGALTTGDGVKTINVRLQDKAGNIGPTTTVTVTLDTQAGIASIINQTWDIVSNLTTHRLNPSGAEIADQYNNYFEFDFSTNEHDAQYKVCIYDEDKSGETATAIPTTGGSINTSGANVAANVNTHVKLTYADLAATSEVGGEDGEYIFCVYFKDDAGNWNTIVIPTI